jgi:hypothetical protein
MTNFYFILIFKNNKRGHMVALGECWGHPGEGPAGHPQRRLASRR